MSKRPVSKSPLRGPTNNLAYLSTLDHKNGMYEGQLAGFRKEGLGIFFWDDGHMYIGEWLNDKPHGKGMLFFPYGGYFFGNFEKNKIKGLGVARYENGGLIAGFWSEDILEGVCFLLSPQKDISYMCEFSRGSFIKTLAEEKILSNKVPEILENYQELKSLVMGNPFAMIGDLLKANNLRQTKNKITTSSTLERSISYFHVTKTIEFLGFSQKNKPTGLGVSLQNGKILCVGSFENGLLEGMGRAFQNDREIFDGMFIKGTFHGKGVYYNCLDNHFMYGEFKNNVCINLLQHGDSYPIEILATMKAEVHKNSTKYYEKQYYPGFLKQIKKIFSRLNKPDIDPTDILQRFPAPGKKMLDEYHYAKHLMDSKTGEKSNENLEPMGNYLLPKNLVKFYKNEEEERRYGSSNNLLETNQKKSRNASPLTPNENHNFKSSSKYSPKVESVAHAPVFTFQDNNITESEERASHMKEEPLKKTERTIYLSGTGNGPQINRVLNQSGSRKIESNISVSPEAHNRNQTLFDYKNNSEVKRISDFDEKIKESYNKHFTEVFIHTNSSIKNIKYPNQTLTDLKNIIENRKAISGKNTSPVLINEGSPQKGIEPFERHYYKNNLNKSGRAGDDENEKTNNFFPMKETIVKKVEFPIEVEKDAKASIAAQLKKSKQGAGRITPPKSQKVLPEHFEYSETEEDNLKFFEHPSENWGYSSSNIIEPKSKLMKSILNKSKLSNNSILENKNESPSKILLSKESEVRQNESSGKKKEAPGFYVYEKIINPKLHNEKIRKLKQLENQGNEAEFSGEDEIAVMKNSFEESKVQEMPVIMNSSKTNIKKSEKSSKVAQNNKAGSPLKKNKTMAITEEKNILGETTKAESKLKMEKPAIRQSKTLKETEGDNQKKSSIQQDTSNSKAKNNKSNNEEERKVSNSNSFKQGQSTVIQVRNSSVKENMISSGNQNNIQKKTETVPETNNALTIKKTESREIIYEQEQSRLPNKQESIIMKDDGLKSRNNEVLANSQLAVNMIDDTNNRKELQKPVEIKKEDSKIEVIQAGQLKSQKSQVQVEEKKPMNKTESEALLEFLDNELAEG